MVNPAIIMAKTPESKNALAPISIRQAEELLRSREKIFPLEIQYQK